MIKTVHFIEFVHLIYAYHIYERPKGILYFQNFQTLDFPFICTYMASFLKKYFWQLFVQTHTLTYHVTCYVVIIFTSMFCHLSLIWHIWVYLYLWGILYFTTWNYFNTTLFSESHKEFFWKIIIMTFPLLIRICKPLMVHLI